MELLSKYGKDVPTTWDELLETGKYILEQERAKGNNDLIGYNGFIPGMNNFLYIYI